MKRNLKRWNIVLIIAILILVLVLVYSGLRILESTVFNKGTGNSQDSPSKTIHRDGVDYYPKQDMTVILVAGVDTEGSMVSSGSYNNSAEADMVALLVFDESTRSMNVISINRDTMTDVQVLGIGGKKAGTVHTQLALAHAYGSGLRDSSENLRDTVSMLMYNVQIDYYLTINMEAINLLNDAVGGVTVNVTDDFSAIDPSIPMGQVTLKGQQATNYLRSRHGLGDQLNLSRMQRHQEYIRGFLTALRTKYESEPSFVLSAFEQINPYMVTNCTTSSISGLLDRYGDFELGEMLSLKGENNAEHEYMEYHLDKDALDELILKYLYSPKK